MRAARLAMGLWLLLLLVCPLKIGQKQFQPSGNRINMSRLCQDCHLSVQPCKQRQQRGRERRQLRKRGSTQRVVR